MLGAVMRGGLRLWRGSLLRGLNVSDWKSCCDGWPRGWLAPPRGITSKRGSDMTRLQQQASCTSTGSRGDPLVLVGPCVHCRYAGPFGASKVLFVSSYIIPLSGRRCISDFLMIRAGSRFFVSVSQAVLGSAARVTG